MAKSKAAAGVPNRPIYSRISYLYQAAAYLGTSSRRPEPRDGPAPAPAVVGSDGQGRNLAALGGGGSTGERALSRRLLTDLRGTSLKSQIRLSPAMKHTICKYCDSLLVEGETSTSVVENASKGGRKPWADVLVVRCHTCAGTRRFPVQAPRQRRRTARGQEAKDTLDQARKGTDVAMKYG
ncbi:Rpr2-domain-containing protein [Xylariaceae sp. FL0804]|nr:Rpr2-domain-containing protein [Xylariaceae sp. FL0804]